MKILENGEHDAVTSYTISMTRQLRCKDQFESELSKLLNKYCIDADLEMADFILARLIVAQLTALEMAKARQNWQETN